jgi:hypothetical protein
MSPDGAVRVMSYRARRAVTAVVWVEVRWTVRLPSVVLAVGKAGCRRFPGSGCGGEAA